MDLPEQFHLEFDYRFNTDGRVVVTVSDIAIDTIHATDFGAGHDAFTTFSRTYVLADYGLTAGPNSLSLTLSNEGDPELFVDNFTVTGHNPIPVPAAMPALLLLLGVGFARCPSMRVRKAGVVHSSRA